MSECCIFMAATKHKLGTTNVGEEVLDLVIPYVEDQKSISLVSRKFCEIVGVMRRRVTIQAYYFNPCRLTKRFPFIESLTLKGPPSDFIRSGYYSIPITPWIEQLALEFRCLKELHLCRLLVRDEDLEKLARTRGKVLRSLKISKCERFSANGLCHVSMYCNQLTTLCLKYCNYNKVAHESWLRQLALNCTGLKRFTLKDPQMIDAENLTLLAKNCCNSLTSLKIGVCNLSKLGDAFGYAVRLEQFSGNNRHEASELVGFKFPPNMLSLSIRGSPVTQYSIVLPFLNQIRKLKLLDDTSNHECQCLFFDKCPNLEVLFTQDVCGDRGLQVIGQCCKKLRKLTHNGVVTHVGLVYVAKGCTLLESLKLRLGDVSNEALVCVGTHLKNLRDFRIRLVEEEYITDLPLDNGVKAMLMGCNKLERLDISLCHEGLTNLGLKYIGMYGSNLRSLSLAHTGESDAGLVKLSQGCPRLRKLKLIGCPFCEQVVTSHVFKILSLRYVWFDFESSDCENSDGEISDGESSDCESSDRESGDRQSSDCESSDRESGDHESSDRESTDQQRSNWIATYSVLTRPEFKL